MQKIKKNTRLLLYREVNMTFDTQYWLRQKQYQSTKRVNPLKKLSNAISEENDSQNNNETISFQETLKNCLNETE